MMKMILIAIAAVVLSSQDAGTQQPERTCPSVEFARGVISQRPGFANFRAVRPDKVAEAIEIFDAVPPNSPYHTWNAAWLVDAEDGGGILMVGRDGKVCQSARFAQQYWIQLIKQIDGVPA